MKYKGFVALTYKEVDGSDLPAPSNKLYFLNKNYMVFMSMPSNHNCPKTKAVILHGSVVECCDNCQNTLVQVSEQNANHRRNAQRRDYAGDITQPFETDYVRNYGVEKAREAGWDEESIRKWS